MSQPIPITNYSDYIDYKIALKNKELEENLNRQITLLKEIKELMLEVEGFRKRLAQIDALGNE